MAVYRDKSNGYDGKTWRVAVYYTDWQGNRKKHEKRGFKTKTGRATGKSMKSEDSKQSIQLRNMKRSFLQRRSMM